MHGQESITEKLEMEQIVDELTSYPQALLICVGGSPNPVIHSLNEQQPDYIIFFASVESQEQVPGILRQIGFQPKAFAQIITPLAEDLSACFAVLRRELPEILERFNLTYQDLTVDYTGGTKTMSAALVLATIEGSSRYSYVGGTERDKQGLGVVIDGRERMLYLVNPWDELAVAENRRISLYFNSARYQSALELIEGLKPKVSEKLLPFYQILSDLVTGYDHWDRFQHERAKVCLHRGKERLRIYAAGAENPKLSELLSRVEENAGFLTALEDKDRRGELLVVDLIANAKRRAELEAKYDDGAARLYRALELAAQARLRSGYGISTSKATPEQLPEALREEYVKKYADEQGHLRLGLYAAYRLLAVLGDELGQTFAQREEEFRRWIDLRNGSILAHGNKPVGAKSFWGFYGFALDFLGFSEGELPVFPKLEL